MVCILFCCKLNDTFLCRWQIGSTIEDAPLRKVLFAGKNHWGTEWKTQSLGKPVKVMRCHGWRGGPTQLSSLSCRNLMFNCKDFSVYEKENSTQHMFTKRLPWKCTVIIIMRLPRWLSGKESAYQCRCELDPWVRKINPLEEEMSSHPNILSWEIPWTGEPGGLQSTGSQRVGHNWTSSAIIMSQKESLLSCRHYP